MRRRSGSASVSHLVVFVAWIASILISVSLGSAVLLAGAVGLLVSVMCGLAVVSMRVGGDLSFILLVSIPMSVLQGIYFAFVSNRRSAYGTSS